MAQTNIVHQLVIQIQLLVPESVPVVSVAVEVSLAPEVSVVSVEVAVSAVVSVPDEPVDPVSVAVVSVAVVSVVPVSVPVVVPVVSVAPLVPVSVALVPVSVVLVSVALVSVVPVDAPVGLSTFAEQLANPMPATGIMRPRTTMMLMTIVNILRVLFGGFLGVSTVAGACLLLCAEVLCLDDFFVGLFCCAILSIPLISSASPQRGQIRVAHQPHGDDSHHRVSPH